MARKARYNNDPDIADIPLAVDEAQWVADNPGSIKDKRDAAHFASRATATSRQVARLRHEFDQELRRRTAAGTINRGTPAAMSPEQAARFLSPEQLAGLFDRLAQDKLAALEAMRETAAEAAVASERLREQLLDALALIAQDPGLSHASRTTLENILHSSAPTPVEESRA